MSRARLLDSLESRGLGRPVDPAVDEALLNAAMVEIAASGYAGLTTAKVARRAGASTASLYRRWRSKDELVAAAAATLAADALRPVDTGSLEGDLRALLAHKAEVATEPIVAALLSLVGAAAHDEALAGVLRREVFEVTGARVAQVFDNARTRGESPHGDPDAVAMMLALAVLAPAIGGQGSPGADAYADLIVRAVSTPTSTPA